MNIKPDLVCYDFDGVMTDNRVLIDEHGTEHVWVNRSDGMAVAALRRLSIAQLIVSTEANPVVTARARKLGIPALQSVADKAATLTEYAMTAGHELSRTVFIGNDVNDLGAMRLVGYPAAPADAHPSVLALAVYVTRARGGDGVIREFVESFLGVGYLADREPGS